MGEPLIGRAGGWFNSMLKSAGVKRDWLWLINVINCRPPNNVFPTDEDARSYISLEEGHQAVQHCLKHHVIPLLKARNWNRIDCLGNKPLQFILHHGQGKNDGIYKWRGSPLPVPAIDPVRPLSIPTIHPAAIARDQTMFPVVVNDLMKTLAVAPERYNLFPSLEDVRAFKATEFAFDIETAGWDQEANAWSREITVVGLSSKVYEAIVVPFHGAYREELKRIFKNAKTVVGHNSVGFDLPILRSHGVDISPSCQHYDTMLLHHLRFPDLGGNTKSGAGHDLEFLASQMTNKPAWKHLKSNNEELYNARDVDVTWQCFLQLKELCQQANLLDIHNLISVPLVQICDLMTKTGFKIEPAHVESVRNKVLKEMADKELLLPEHLRTQWKPKNRRVVAPPGTLGKSGKPIKFVMVADKERVVPWRSPKIKAQWLYKDLGLEAQFNEEGNLTTGKVALDRLINRCRKSKDEKLRAQAPAMQALKRLNQLDELETTFCKKEMLEATATKMHAHFSVHGTSSGRLSSSDPNCQNIPEYARSMYVASEPGWVIIDVDYSQLENRLTAKLANDVERLRRLDMPGFSEHKDAASLFFDIPYNEIVKDNDKDAPYGKAKRIVHGTNYLMGALKIAKMYDMDIKETKDLQVKWKKRIGPSIDWMMARANEAGRTSVLTNPFARKRWFWTESLATEAASFIPQSTGADIIFRAMIGLMYERIGWPLEKALQVSPICEALPWPARLLIQVHDSLVLECPEELVPEVVRVLKRVMSQPWKQLGGMWIPVGIKVGPSWGEATDYKA
jgi:uracil-DNA glycosylase family 4